MFSRDCEQRICKFGLNCRYGLSCKFYHPSREANYNNKNNPIEGTTENLMMKFEKMNLSNGFDPESKSQQGIIIDDAQYQQNISESNFNLVSQKGHCQQPHLVMAQNFKKGKKQKQKLPKNEQSSDEQSDAEEQNDIQVSSSEDENQEKYEQKINRDAKMQQISQLLAQDKVKKEKKKKWFFQFQTKNVNPQAYTKYAYAFDCFFEKRHIKPHQRQQILQFVAKQFEFNIAVAQMTIQMIEELEKLNYIDHFNYKKLFKVIVKQKFDMNAVKLKLEKKINIQSKRKQKNDQFSKRFPFPIQVDFLQSKDLLNNQLTSKNTIYLIDGNNCMVTQKHLRFHFQSKSIESKVEAQLRFRWLISLVLKDPKRTFVFFDNQYDHRVERSVAQRIMSYQEFKRVTNSLAVIYPENNMSADSAIRTKLKELSGKLQQSKLLNIILISADRVLVQQCYQIHFLRKSSGLYFIKFLKKYYTKFVCKSPFEKKYIKRVLSYGQ